MRNTIKIGMALVLACLMAACADDPKMAKKDRSVGGTSEILVVTQNDAPRRQPWQREYP